MNTQDTAWIDLVSPSHPFFFASLAKHLDGLDITTTVRKKTETVDLAEEVGFDFKTVGRDFSQKWLKIAGIPARTIQLAFQAPNSDIALCSRNIMCILAAKTRGIPTVHFTDNDVTAHRNGLTLEKRYNQLESLANYNIVPSAFETQELTKWHAEPSQILTYDGYKEDVYVADFEPNKRFTEQLPFKEYIVIRPEALDATYVDADQSLVPDLLELAVAEGYNVVYLPRGRGDKHFSDGYPSDTVFTPNKALNGLDLAWHSQGVLTGSGTMAREAACMGKPAVSFFPNSPLSVDQAMVSDGEMIHTRSPNEIIDYLIRTSKSELKPDLSRSKKVQSEVTELVQSIYLN